MTIAFLVRIFALVGVTAPCLFLALSRGGTPVESLGPGLAWIFLALALLGVVQLRPGTGIRIPKLAGLVVLWPLAQLAPWPPRALERAEFAAAGILTKPSISIYPYATMRAVLVLAGAVAVFLLTREVCRRGALGWMAAAVLGLALAEVMPAVRQHLTIERGAEALDYVRGTFGNRNLLAAWLEGCFGAALALAAGRRTRPAVAVLAGGVALASALTVVCSFSRMGLAVLAIETLALAAVQRGNWGRGLPILLAVAAGLSVAAAAMPGWEQRYTGTGLAAEKQGRLAMWSDAAAAMQRYPLLGAGVGAFPFAFRRSHPYLAGYTIDHPHNEYLETAVEWGIPVGVALIIGVVAGLLGCLPRIRRAPAPRRDIGWGCLVGAAGLLLHAGVDFPLRIPAILMLFSMLWGMAAAAGESGAEAHPARRGETWVIVGAAVVLGFGALSHFPEQWNADAWHRAGQQAFDQGQIEQAEASFRRAAAANPYSAVAWNELALLAEARGDRAGALRFSEISQTVEPHTRRGQWLAANLRLRLGDQEEALRLFGALVLHSPEWRQAAWEVCRRAGAPEREIGEKLAGQTDIKDYLRYLVEHELWQEAVDASIRHGQAGALPYEALYKAGEWKEILRLWEGAGSGNPGFANGDLGEPLRGWGLDWAIRPVEGVDVERRRDEDGFRLDVEFRRPQNIEYAGVTHDFAVTAGRDYALRFEAQAWEIGSSSGVRVEVISLGRRLARSEAFLRTTGWRPVELRFRPSVGERILRMRVLRPASSRFDNRISGRFSLRHVRLVGLGQR